MSTDDMTPLPAAAAQPAAGGPDPLAAFVSPQTEADGVLIDVEHPTTGATLMRVRVARFGGRNNGAIIREERQRKAKLPQGVRRQIDAGGGDPDVINRLNRQVFVAVSVLGWEMVDPALSAKYGEFSKEKAEKLFEDYPRLYDLVSEKAVDEETFATDQMADDLGNSASA